MKTNVKIDLAERTATVSGGITEKYARKLLQDKLKSDTPFKGGWECFLLTDRVARPRDAVQNMVSVDGDYVFELYNPFASMTGYFHEQ